MTERLPDPGERLENAAEARLELEIDLIRARRNCGYAEAEKIALEELQRADEETCSSHETIYPPKYWMALPLPPEGLISTWHKR